MVIPSQSMQAPSRVLALHPWRARLGLLAQAAGLFVLFATLLGLVQYSTPALADNDGYYHMKLAALMREGGLTPPFVWLPLSILSRAAFYDHHMLFHAYLALFTGDGSEAALLQGAKLASVIMPALAFVAVWWLLRGQQVPYAALWALGLFAISEAFLYRMSQPRAQAAALLLLVLALHWLLQGRERRLLPLGFAFVWLYNAFPLLLVLAGVYTAATLLIERRLAWRALCYPALGVALGLLINPYFPQNISFIISHIVPKITNPTETAVGNEWYPYQTWTLVQNSGGALAAWVLGVFAIGWGGQRFSRAQLTTFALSVVFGYMLFKSRRFVEYFPPFALIFAALACAPLLQRSANRCMAMLRPARLLLPAVGALLLAVLISGTLPAAQRAMASARPAGTYAAAAHWLRDHTPAGSIVFQTDWDDFPRLFFYNSQNTYLAGLDPTYFELYDQQLYQQWVQITRGKVAEPGRLIREQFGARYVISDLEHEHFIAQAKRDASIQEVYRDQDAVIFAISE